MSQCSDSDDDSRKHGESKPGSQGGGGALLNKDSGAIEWKRHWAVKNKPSCPPTSLGRGAAVLRFVHQAPERWAAIRELSGPTDDKQ